MKITV